MDSYAMKMAAKEFSGCKFWWFCLMLRREITVYKDVEFVLVSLLLTCIPDFDNFNSTVDKT